MRFLLCLLVLAGASALAAATSALGAEPGGWTGAYEVHPQAVTLTIARDGTLAPASFAVQPGGVVTVTVVNRSAKAHTFTAPGLHLGAWIAAARGAHAAHATFSFTATRGVYRWTCTARDGGSMGGYVYAIIGGV